MACSRIIFSKLEVLQEAISLVKSSLNWNASCKIKIYSCDSALNSTCPFLFSKTHQKRYALIAAKIFSLSNLKFVNAGAEKTKFSEPLDPFASGCSCLVRLFLRGLEGDTILSPTASDGRGFRVCFGDALAPRPTRVKAEFREGDKLQESDGFDSWTLAYDGMEGDVRRVATGLFLRPGSSVSSVSGRWSILNDFDEAVFWSCSDGNFDGFRGLFP